MYTAVICIHVLDWILHSSLLKIILITQRKLLTNTPVTEIEKKTKTILHAALH